MEAASIRHKYRSPLIKPAHQSDVSSLGRGQTEAKPRIPSQHHLHFPRTEEEHAASVSVSPSFMSGMPKYPFRRRKTQCSPRDLRSDTSRETGCRAQSTAADLVSPKLSYELFQQNGFHLLCEIANLDCKIHCAHPAM